MSERDPYAFLSPATAAAGVGLRTPMERAHLAAGAELAELEGWRVAAYPPAEADAWACDLSHLGKLDLRGSAELTELEGWRVAAYPPAAADAWASDVSHLGKLDLRGSAEQLDALTAGLATGAARSDDGVWTLRLTPTHGYVLAPFPRVGALRDRIGAAAIDVSCGLAAVALGGARRRDVFNRCSGLDVREARFGPNRCMAGSVMRVPTLVLNRGEDLVMLVAWEYGEYFFDAVLDAGETVGIARASAVPAAALEQEEATA